jgi:hypothetical protein
MNAAEQFDHAAWVSDTVERAQSQNYRVTPIYDTAKRKDLAFPFAKGQTYGPDCSKYAEAKHVGLVLDDAILLDYDGNKAGDDIMSLDELAHVLGLEALPSPVQIGSNGTSLHFLFRKPEGLDLKSSADGAWPHIDIKTGNQLMHIKPHKVLNALHAVEELPEAPQALVDKLRRQESTLAASPAVKVSFKGAHDMLKSGANIHASCQAIYRTLVRRGWADANIIDYVAQFKDDIIKARGVDRWNSLQDELARGIADWRQRIDKGLIDRYWFIDAESQYLDTDTLVIMAPSAVNAVNAHLYTGPPMEGVPHCATTEITRSGRMTTVNGLGWLPVEDTAIFEYEGRTLANMWKGLPIESAEGDPFLWLELMRHIYAEYADLVIDHMAFSVQRPAEKIRWQVMTFGTPRTGKTATVRPLERIWGGGCKNVDGNTLGAGWGDYFFKTKVLIAEEVMAEGQRAFFNQLKTKLANDGVEALNIKGQGVVYQRNLYACYMFSNEPGALTFARNEDKLLVIKAPDTPCWDDFSPYYDAVDRGVLAGQVLGYLLQRDVSKFPHGRLPVRTAALAEMVREGAAEFESLIIDGVECRCSPFDTGDVTASEVIDWLVQEHYLKPLGPKAIGGALRRLGWKDVRGYRKVDGEVKVTATVWLEPGHEMLGASSRALFDWLDDG